MEAVGICGCWSWGGCEEEYIGIEGTFGSCDDCGRDREGIWGFTCPLGGCGICRGCEDMGWDWRFSAGTAADKIGITAWFWCCFLVGGFWDALVWSCIPTWLDDELAAWIFDGWIGCAACWGCGDTGGWMVGI